MKIMSHEYRYKNSKQDIWKLSPEIHKKVAHYHQVT